jgi:hypothetical protein
VNSAHSEKWNAHGGTCSAHGGTGRTEEETRAGAAPSGIERPVLVTVIRP